MRKLRHTGIAGCQRMTRDLMRGLLAAFLLCGAADLSAADEWEFDGNLYVWMPQLDVTTQGGTEIDIGFLKIFEDLEGLFMGGVGAKKGKWSSRPTSSTSG